MELNEEVQLLRKIPMFAKADLSKLKLIAFTSDRMTFDDDEVLCVEGDAAESVWVIVEGEVVVESRHGGKSAVVAVRKPNDLVGELAIIRNTPRTATMRARGRVQLLSIPQDVFLKIVTEDPQIALEIMRILSEKLATAPVMVDSAEPG